MKSELQITSHKNSSFTLIETLVAIAVFALAMGTVSALVIMIYKTQDYAWHQSRAIEEAEKGVETMIKEIREAMLGDDGFYTIEKADDNEFIFYSDIDKDESTERVRYYIDGLDFKKEVIKPTVCCPIQYIKDKDDPEYTGQVTTLSQNVRNDSSDPAQHIFKYYNEDWIGSAFCEANPLEEICLDNPLPTPARLKQTRLMYVFLIVNYDPDRIPKGYELASGVQIRNLKDNL